MTLPQLVREARNSLKTLQQAKEVGEEFAKRLDEYLSDVTAVDLAAKLDVSPQYLSDVRHRRRAPSQALLELIAELETKS